MTLEAPHFRALWQHVRRTVRVLVAAFAEVVGLDQHQVVFWVACMFQTEPGRASAGGSAAAAQLPPVLESLIQLATHGPDHTQEARQVHQEQTLIGDQPRPYQILHSPAALLSVLGRLLLINSCPALHDGEATVAGWEG